MTGQFLFRSSHLVPLVIDHEQFEVIDTHARSYLCQRRGPPRASDVSHSPI